MISPQSLASSSSRCGYRPPRFMVRTWYVAMVTGRTSFTAPEYSPISSSVRDVRLSSSSFHCRAETVLVTRISVVVWLVAIAAAPTSVLPGAARQHDDAAAAGPEVLHRQLLVRAAGASRRRSARSGAAGRPRSRPGPPPASRSSAAAASAAPRWEECTTTVIGSIRGPSRGSIFLARMTSSSTG